MRILIVEDEVFLAREIRKFLEKEGFSCKEAHDGKNAIEMINLQFFDLILLDLNMPDLNGLDILKEALLIKSSIAVIILSARNSTEDRIAALDSGADDYITKPFSLVELKSRILAIMRRKNDLKGNVIQINRIEIDIGKRKVTFNDQIIDLTRKEYDILSFLVLNKNKVVSRLQISEIIWGDILDERYHSNFIDVHIKNLRRKLSSYINCDFLETVRGIGFRLNEKDSSTQTTP